jgi:hypothetical protein
MAMLANPPRVSTVRLLRTLMGEDPNAPLPTVEAPEAEN